MKKKYSLFLLFGLLFLGCIEKNGDFSEKSTNDTLANYLVLANEDTIPYEKRVEYNKKAFAIIINQNNDSLNRVNLFKVANRYFNMKNLEEYAKTTKVIIEKAKISKDTSSIAKAYFYLGDFYAGTFRKDSAFLYYSKAEKIYQKVEDKANLSSVYLSMAIVQNNEKDFSGSELSVIKALNILRDTDDKTKKYDAYNILGIVSSELNDDEKALEYHQKALDIVKQNDLSFFHQKTTTLNNIGNIYQKQNKDLLAIEKFKEGLQDNGLLEDDPNLYAILLDNLAYSKFKLRDFSQLPDLFYQSLEIREKNNFTLGIIYNKLHLSEFYAFNKDTIKAKDYAQQALKLSRETKSSGDILGSLRQLGVIDPSKSSIYAAEYIKINDSLQNAERKSKDKFLRIQYETDEIIQEKDKLAEQNRNMIFFFGLIIMIGILLFVIRNQRTRTKELLLKQAQQKANEDIYNLMLFQQNKIEESRINEKVRIAQELHDGILGRLFGARLNLDSLNKRQDDAAIDVRNNYLVELKHIEQDIREISHDLNREKSALNNNFISIVNNLIDQQENLSEARVSFLIDMEIEWEKIENNIKINLYRILQESLQNINKYAEARNIKIEIKKTDKFLKLTVADDGIGFSVKKKSKGIGLQNMLSRAEASQGILDVKSKPGRGTSITVTVPIEINTKTE